MEIKEEVEEPLISSVIVKEEYCVQEDTEFEPTLDDE